MQPFALYVAADGQIHGPLDERQLALHLAAGGFRANDQGCWAGLDAWMKLSEMVDVDALREKGRAALKSTPRLAPKGRRILAFLLDVVAALVVMIVAPPVLLFCGLLLVCGLGGVEQTPHVSSIIIVVAASLSLLGFTAAQVVGLYRNGQSVGKRLAGVRVVGTDGQRVRFGRILLRTFVPPLIVLTPVFGLIWLVVSGCLFLFGTRRALHDRLADTCVVSA